MITRSNVGKGPSDVALCDHNDLAACWSCETMSSANLEAINFKSASLMDIQVRWLRLAAVQSDATVVSGYVSFFLRHRPTPLSLVRKTSSSPALPCGIWPPLGPLFCITAFIRGFLSMPAARYERSLRVSSGPKLPP